MPLVRNTCAATILLCGLTAPISLNASEERKITRAIECLAAANSRTALLKVGMKSGIWEPSPFPHRDLEKTQLLSDMLTQSYADLIGHIAVEDIQKFNSDLVNEQLIQMSLLRAKISTDDRQLSSSQSFTAQALSGCNDLVS